MFNEQLKNIRKASGKTQKDLADYLQISAQSISKWEKGEALPSLEFLPQIARFFGCSVNAFFTEIERNSSSVSESIDSTGEALELEEKINGALRHFRLNAEVVRIHEGVRIFSCVVAMFEGCGLSDIKKRAKDILYQINEDRAIFNTKDYKDNTFAIEVPRKDFKGVPLEFALKSDEYVNSGYKIPLVIGYDVHDNLIIDDLTRMPHLLLGGVTGSGKSTFLRNIVTCLTSRFSSEEVKLVMCDMKKCEFEYAKNYPHLYGQVITTFDDAIETMRSLVEIMEDRIIKMAQIGVRNISDYNNIAETKYARMILIIDELADLKIYSSEIEELIMQLTMKGRAAGIHVIISTQVSSVHIITGVIKANIPSRASMRVLKQLDSRIILDDQGAELLSDRGDMLYNSCFLKGLLRVQIPYISEEESIALAKKE